MMRQDRLTEIEHYLQKKGYCKMSELASHVGVSLATIHRDVQGLTDAGRVKKVHGGVMGTEIEGHDSLPDGSHFLQRMELQREAKSRIAAMAESEIVNGDIVFLDSSTTSAFLARRLQESRLSELSILTNSALIAQEFHRFPPHFVLVCIGGNFNFQLNAFLGSMALESLRRLRVTKAFISCAGYADGHATTYLEDHAVFLRGVLEMAAKSYLLIDGSKYTRTGLYEICDEERFEKVITA